MPTEAGRSSLALSLGRLKFERAEYQDTRQPPQLFFCLAEFVDVSRWAEMG